MPLLAQTTQTYGSSKKVVAEVTETIAGVTADPTSITGYVAFKTSRYGDGPGDDFTAAEWNPATWESANRHYFLTALVGPDGVPLARGRWHVFTGLDAPDEKPIEYAGVHTIW